MCNAKLGRKLSSIRVVAHFQALSNWPAAELLNLSITKLIDFRLLMYSTAWWFTVTGFLSPLTHITSLQ